MLEHERMISRSIEVLDYASNCGDNRATKLNDSLVLNLFDIDGMNKNIVRMIEFLQGFDRELDLRDEPKLFDTYTSDNLKNLAIHLFYCGYHGLCGRLCRNNVNRQKKAKQFSFEQTLSILRKVI